MKRQWTVLFFLLCSLAVLAGCGTQKEPANAALGTQERPLVVGVTAGPQAQILEQVKTVAARDGFVIKVAEFTDFVTPNQALANGEIDANAYQHQPYLNHFNVNNGDKLVSIGKTVLLPMALYAPKYQTLNALPDGAKVAIPNDPTNGGRALLLLQSAGLIQLGTNDITVTVADVKENPHHFEFLEVEAAQVPRSLDDVDAAVINTNYALEAGLSPVADARFVETKESPYACVLAVQKEAKTNAAYAKLLSYYQSEPVRDFIHKEFKGALVPAF